MYRVIFVLVLGTVATQASDPDIIYGPKPVGCELPPYPEHGTYTVSRIPSARPGQIIESVLLRYKCDDGYGIYGLNEIFCVKGLWSLSFPTCVRFCKLPQDPKMEYKCMDPDEGYRECYEYEPSGVVVQPACRPGYYSHGLSNMTCVEGHWDHIPHTKCKPECGTLSQDRDLSGTLPWGAAIYDKQLPPNLQVCGGSLVSDAVVLSAATCFWVRNKLDAKENYVVAIGNTLITRVKEIHIPPNFTGEATNYQSNMAVVLLEVPVTFNSKIRPVCLNFNEQFSREQLREGNLGTFNGWGSAADGHPPIVMKIEEIPFVDRLKCIQSMPAELRSTITNDNFCARYNDTYVDGGNSGVGLAFPWYHQGKQRFYLRGIASGKLVFNDCFPSSRLIVFTDVNKYEHFIKEYL